MAPSWRRMMAALAVGLTISSAAGPAAAQSAGGESLARLDRLAVQLRQDGLSPHLSGQGNQRETLERRNRERLIASLSAVALAIIAAEPQRRDEVLSAAERAAPEVTGEVRARILEVFPGAAATRSSSLHYPRPSTVGGSGAVGSPPARGREPTTSRPGSTRAALTARRREQADADYAARLEAWLIGAIARDPAGLEAHLQSAAAAMPEARERLVAAASRAFPGHAGRLAAGGPTPAAAEDEPPLAAAPDMPAVEADAVGPEAVWDPLEPMNRLVDSVNQMIDFVVLRPVAKVYSTVAPDPVILAMRRFFENLKQPVVVANDLFQLTFRDAAVAAGRFGVNTTIGLLGFFDPATGMGLESHHADFGQTLHSYGLGPGPYLVLPLLGPSTARDGVGEVVDIFLQPLGYILPQEASLALAGSKAVVKREELLAPLDELKASSVDYYSGLRSAYYQRRALQLNKGRGMLAAPDVETDRLFDEAR